MPKPAQQNLLAKLAKRNLLVQSSQAVLEIKMVALGVQPEMCFWEQSLEKGVSEIRGPSERVCVAQEDCVLEAPSLGYHLPVAYALNLWEVL